MRMRSFFAGLSGLLFSAVAVGRENTYFHDIDPGKGALGLGDEVMSNDIHADYSDFINRRVLDKKNIKHEETISSIVGTLEARLIELGLTSLINEDYLGKVVEEGNEREFQEKLGITRELFNGSDADYVSMAYKAVKRDHRSPAGKRKAGEEYLFYRRFPDQFVQLSLITGNSEWLTSTRDSSRLCAVMNRTSGRIYEELKNKTGFTAENLLRDSWDTVLKEVTTPGCLSALYAVISPRKRISISNLGRSWAGLFRNGNLIKSTHRAMHRDRSPYQLCLPDKVYEPLHQDPLYQSSRTYEWISQAGDILVMVSNGVREVLQPSEIYGAFTTVQKMESGEMFSSNNIDFSLVAMGIAKAAEIASGNPQKNDISVLAAVIK